MKTEDRDPHDGDGVSDDEIDYRDIAYSQGIGVDDVEIVVDELRSRGHMD